MSRLVAFLIGSFIATAVMVMVVFVFGPLLLDANDFKERIASLIEEKTGRSITIEGNIEFSFQPDVQIVLGRSTMANPVGFSEPSLARFDQAILIVKPIPLMLGRLEVTDVSITGLVLSLERLANGRANWDEMRQGFPRHAGLEKLGDATILSASSDVSPLKLGFSGLAVVSAGGVHLERAVIHWHDRSRNESATLSDLNTSSHDGAHGAIRLALDGNWDLAHRHSHGQVSLGYDLKPEIGELKLDNVRLLLRGQSSDTFVREAELRLVANISLNSDQRRVVLDGMELGTRTWFSQRPLRDVEMSLKGRTEVDTAMGLVKIPQAQAVVKAKSDNLSPVGVQVAFDANLLWNAVSDSLTLEEINARGPADTSLSGLVTFRDLLSQPSVAGEVKIETLDPLAMMVALGRTLPKANESLGFSKGTLEAGFQVGPQGFQVEHFIAGLDETRLEGKLQWQGYEKPVVALEVAVDKVNLERYWPEGGSFPGGGKKALASMLVPELGLAGMFGGMAPDLDFTASIRGENVGVFGAELTHLKLDLHAKDGLFIMDPFSFELFGGVWNQKVQMDSGHKPPKMTVEKELKGIQVQPFLLNLAGVGWLSGTMDLSGQVETEGENFFAARENLKGTYWVGMHGGGFDGLDVPGRIRKIVLALDGRPMGEESSKKGEEITEFSELTATAQVSRGRLVNKDLLAVSPVAVIKGEGEVNLVNMTMDYTFSADAQASLKGMDVGYWNRLSGVALPIRLSGNLDRLAMPVVGEALLTRRIVVARQAALGEQKEVAQGLEEQRNRRPLTRWGRGLFH